MLRLVLCGVAGVAHASGPTQGNDLLLPDERTWMTTLRAEPPEIRAKALLAKMNQSEKLAMLHGIGAGYVGNVQGNTRLGIPQLNLNDGPQGFRGTSGTSTAWPAALSVAASWSEETMFAWGKGMGEEFFAKGSNVQLGPGVCLARVPVNGRNFEYLSGEDPFLGYTLAQPTVRGIQGEGVIANAKHFVNNNQETNRGAVSENVDERTRFEMYYPPFEGAVKAGLGSIMCSCELDYQYIIALRNGYFPSSFVDSQNAAMLQTTRSTMCGAARTQTLLATSRRTSTLLVGGATHSTSLTQGLDQEMPGSSFMNDQNILAQLSAGNTTQAHIDDAVYRQLLPMFAVGVFDKKGYGEASNNVTSPEHNTLARNLSAAGTVLLQNNAILPLSPAKAPAVAVIGWADGDHIMTHGGGSGQVIPYYAASPFRAIRQVYGLPPPPPPPPLAPGTCAPSTWLNDTDLNHPDPLPAVTALSPADCCAKCGQTNRCKFWTLAGDQCWLKETNAGRKTAKGLVSGSCSHPPVPPPPKDAVQFDNGQNVTAAQALAKESSVAIIFVATTSSEGGDRSSLSLGQAQDELVYSVCAANPKCIVVIETPGAVLTPWRNVTAAIVTNFMPGQEGGNAIVDVLYGSVNPAGKLPLTFPTKDNEVNFTARMYPGVFDSKTMGPKQQEAYYEEKLLVGYRYYDAKKIDPAFPFGHGLSYTTFAYSELEASPHTCSFTLTNNGTVIGAEVAQLYLSFPPNAGEPPRQLKGFKKIELAPGASATIDIALTPRDLSIWSTSSHEWELVKGTFGVHVGSSSRDIRLDGTFTV